MTNNINNAHSNNTFAQMQNLVANSGLLKDVQTVAINGFAKVCGDFITRIQDNISSAGITVTGEINNISVVTNGNTVSVVAPAHLMYQNFGVSGKQRNIPNSPFKYTNKKPPASVFKTWLNRSRNATQNFDSEFNLPNRVRGTHNATDSIAYAIRESIYKNGFPALNLYTHELPQLYTDLQTITGNNVSNMVTTILKQTHIGTMTFMV